MQEIILDYLDTITVIATDKKGNKIQLIHSAEDIKERIKSVMYQTFSHAFADPVGMGLEMFVMENLPSTELIDDIRSGKAVIEYWNQHNISKDWRGETYFIYISEKKYTFSTQEEAQYQYKLAYAVQQYKKR